MPRHVVRCELEVAASCIDVGVLGDASKELCVCIQFVTCNGMLRGAMCSTCGKRMRSCIWKQLCSLALFQYMCVSLSL